MNYLKLIKNETNTAELLFSLIHTLSNIPDFGNHNQRNLLFESKSMLRELLVSSEQHVHQPSGYKYYKLKGITYYQNGLCTYDNQRIILDKFGEKQEEQAHEIAKHVFDKFFVSCQVKAHTDHTYKFSSICNSKKGSLERIVSNCEFLAKKNKKDEEAETAITNTLKVLAPDDVFYVILPDKISEYVKDYGDDLLIKKELQGSVVEKGRAVIDLLREIDETDIASRMRVLER